MQVVGLNPARHALSPRAAGRRAACRAAGLRELAASADASAIGAWDWLLERGSHAVLNRKKLYCRVVTAQEKLMVLRRGRRKRERLELVRRLALPAAVNRALVARTSYRYASETAVRFRISRAGRTIQARELPRAVVEPRWVACVGAKELERLVS